MFADQIEQRNAETKFTKLVKKSIDDLIPFIENCLKEFPQKYKKYFKSNEYKPEPEVNYLLSIYMTQNCRYKGKPYNFAHECPQHFRTNKIGKQSTVDIGINYCFKDNYNFITFFVIECKWLRLPPSLSKQYVSGDTGGIERFKRELHGQGLKQSAMIGYIEKENFEFWFKTINEWITEQYNNNDSINWEELDLLKTEKISELTASYISKNKRKNDYIKIYHIWVYMLPKII